MQLMAEAPLYRESVGAFFREKPEKIRLPLAGSPWLEQICLPPVKFVRDGSEIRKDVIDHFDGKHLAFEIF
jgi:hypothetical protein